MPTVNVPKTVKVELVKRILAEGKPRSFEDFVALAFGPEALVPKPIKVTPQQLQVSRTLFSGETGATRAQGFLAVVPAIRLFMRERPRMRKQFIAFCDEKLVQMNGNGNGDATAHVSLDTPHLSAARTKAAEGARAKAIARLREMLKVGRKQCSKCGKTKVLDKFTRQRNPYYPEVGEEMMPGSWCLDCAAKKK